MTQSEIQNILTMNYIDLWNQLWNKTNESYDRKNMEKFNYIVQHKKHIFDNVSGWEEPEWGFPKGRRNARENDFDCSIREFEEETGYNSKDLIMIKNIGFFEETFTGSNMKSYRHKYYLCQSNYEKTIDETKYQKSEIGNLKWFTFEECLAKIRFYNYEKRRMLCKINNIISNK